MKKKKIRIILLSILGLFILGVVYIYYSFVWIFFVKPGDGGYNYNLKIYSLAGSNTGENGFNDGQGDDIRMYKPIRFAPLNDSTLIFADINNHAIRTISSNGTVKTLCGGPDKQGYKDGNLLDSEFDNPHGVAVRNDGVIAVCEVKNNTIRLLTPKTSNIDGKITYEVSTLAGKSGEKGFQDGEIEEALFNSPHSVVWGQDGELYIADIGNSRIRMIKDGKTTTIAGRDETGKSDGNLNTGTLKYPIDITTDKNGNLWIVDAGTMTIRKWEKNKGLSTPFPNIKIAMPHCIAIFDNKYLLVAEMYGHRILMYDMKDGKVSTICGTTEKGIGDNKLNKPAAVIVNNDKIWIADLGNNRIVFTKLPF